MVNKILIFQLLALTLSISSFAQSGNNGQKTKSRETKLLKVAQRSNQYSLTFDLYNPIFSIDTAFLTNNKYEIAFNAVIINNSCYKKIFMPRDTIFSFNSKCSIWISVSQKHFFIPLSSMLFNKAGKLSDVNYITLNPNEKYEVLFHTSNGTWREFEKMFILNNTKNIDEFVLKRISPSLYFIYEKNNGDIQKIKINNLKIGYVEIKAIV